MKEKTEMFRNRLAKVFRHRRKEAVRAGVSCFRVYDHDLPEFPLCIELYGDKLYVAEYRRRHGLTESEHIEWLKKSIEVISEVFQLPPENIFVKLRQRKAGREGQYKKQSGAKSEFIIEENGLKFIINLSDYLDTGLFLDHRVTRQMIKDRSSGMKVLNLFAYTGSFSVYAAAGNASEVVTVDLSKTYLRWAERNMKLNGFESSERYRYVHADVKEFLKTLQESYFDIIVMDPPTFSNSRRMKDILDVQRDHVYLINQCLYALKPAGKLYFSTNYTKFKMDAGKITAAEIKDITKATIPFDFTGKFHRFCFSIQK